MTEDEWLQCDSPTPLLEWLAETADAAEGRRPGPNRDRKFRLFACACLRLTWTRLPGTSRGAVAFMERYADGGDAKAWKDESRRVKTRGDPGIQALNLFWDGYNLPASVCSISGGTMKHGADAASQVALLRCIFGNPFRPATLAPALRGPTITSLAAALYDERQLPSGHLDPLRAAVLADALEEAGCTDANLLDHLRSPGPHVRGCRAVDLILAKT